MGLSQVGSSLDDGPMPAPLAAFEPATGTDGGAPVGSDPARTPATGGFGTLLSRAVDGLVDQVQSADRMQELAATGQLSDPTLALVETTQAELALSTAVQVRNRLIEGWQELSRMQV